MKLNIKRNFLLFTGKLIKKITENRRKKDIILFGSRSGNHYMDNSRSLYEWYIKNRPSEKVYWMTRSQLVYTELKKKKYPVAKINSIKGIILLNQASIGVYTNLSLDIAYQRDMMPQNIKLIYLSHGQGLKNTRLLIKSGIKENFKMDILKTSKLVHLAPTTSDFIANSQSLKLNIPISKYKITGLPRNDDLFIISDTTKEKWDNFKINIECEKVILYSPTWRMTGEKTRFFPFEDYNPILLKEFLEKEKTLLLLRPHIKDLELNELCNNHIENLVNLTNNIRLASHEIFIDAQEILPFVDGLITDYSSIYLDYLILDKPIFFIPYDYKEFEKDNGFTIPYYENLPGTVITSQINFLKEINLLTEDNFRTKRITLRKKIHHFIDGNSCQRVAKEIDLIK